MAHRDTLSRDLVFPFIHEGGPAEVFTDVAECGAQISGLNEELLQTIEYPLVFDGDGDGEFYACDDPGL